MKIKDIRAGLFVLAVTWAAMLPADIIINEIVYNDGPTYPGGDWVELFNGSPEPVVVGNWVLKDDNDLHMYTIPAGTVIQAYGYLVVYSQVAFTTVYPGVSNKVGPSDLGFKNDEEVRLYDDVGDKVDEVNYEAGIDGWPNADGNDHSIELVYPFSDNNAAYVWRASVALGGSPGQKNPGANGINFISHSRLPNAPDDNDPVDIVAEIRDAFATITSVVIYVQWNDGTYQPLSMDTVQAGEYSITMPPTNNGTRVWYYFSIHDNGGSSLERWWTGTNVPYMYLVDNTPVNSGLVINEIMYNSSNLWIVGAVTSGYEYVELYNTFSTPIDMSYWRFEDESDKYRLPPFTTIPANGFLVLADNTQAIRHIYGPTPTNAVITILPDLGLKNSGETIRLQNANGQKVDEVSYDDDTPWPSEPDGNGPSLELIHWTLDNELPSSWDASMGLKFLGTPGEMNSVVPEPLCAWTGVCALALLLLRLSRN